MPNEFLIPSNDTENGYIYRELNNRLSRAEKTIEDLFNLLEKANQLGVSGKDITNMVSELKKKADRQYVQNHVEDSVRHLNDVKVMEWDNKYDLPLNGIPEEDLDVGVRRKLNNSGSTSGEKGLLKYSIDIGNNITNAFAIRHSLGTKDINVNIWEIETKELVYANVSIIDDNTIKVQFAMIPKENQFKVTIIG